MKTPTLLRLILLVCIAGSRNIWADSAPSKPTAGTTMGDVRVQTLQPYSYAYVSADTTFDKLQDTISTLMPRVDAAIDSGGLRPVGSYVFTYHGVSMDTGKHFTLDIGIMVKDTGSRPAGIQFANVGPLHCATVIYAGPVAQIGAGYNKLFAGIGQLGVRPTDITREVYLYWEGANSVNNIIQIQAELAN